MKGAGKTPFGQEDLAMDTAAHNYRRFLDGDAGAFDDIIHELFEHLVFFIDRYVQDIHTAEDIAIDVFSDLVIHRSRYNFRVTLKTYVFMLGRSRALNYIKRRNRFRTEPLCETESSIADRILLEDQFLKNERNRLVNQALTSLPDDMRSVIHLVYFEELSYEEAASIMRKNKKQVDNLLYRAKQLLRTTLGKEGEDLL